MDIIHTDSSDTDTNNNITDTKHAGSSKLYDFVVGQHEILFLNLDDIRLAVSGSGVHYPTHFIS